MEVADADSQQTTNERLATSASKLISDYILAKLLGTSPARLPTNVILPTLGGFPKVPSVPFPVLPRAYGEVNGRPELDRAGSVTASSNKSTVSYVDDAGSSQVEDSVDQSDAPVRRVPVTSPSSLHRHLHHHQHHHRLGVNEVKETLMEWNGDRGKARSVSNAAANLVVFAPLFPRVRTPEVVIPTATSVTFQRLPPSTAPSSLSSLLSLIHI